PAACWPAPAARPTPTTCSACAGRQPGTRPAPWPPTAGPPRRTPGSPWPTSTSAGWPGGAATTSSPPGRSARPSACSPPSTRPGPGRAAQLRGRGVTGGDGVTARAAELRRDFDAGFAQPPPAPAPPPLDLLAIRVADQHRALRLDEVARLVVDLRVTPLPSVHPELLGLAAPRGTAVPVFDLRLLLGLPAEGPLRWAVLVRSAEACAV